jgi:SAM-dependent methyltransferase
VGGDALACGQAHAFPIRNGIPLMFVPNDWEPGRTDVTDTVKSFYEQTPFPNYDEFDSVGALMQKSRTGLFARLLDEQVPLRARVLEVGCGTGQLSNFLGVAQREVFGADVCVNSLTLAEDFRRRNNLANVGFYQMNLFRPVFKPGSFDLVISNGVLHHTSDPFGGFKSIATLVKPGGYIVIGLYNRYGRLMTDLRRLLFRATGRRFMFIDPYLRERARTDAKTDAWFADQYQHPHESKHTMGEVLRWFDETGFQFVNGIPKNRFMDSFTDDEQLFAIQPRADRVSRAAVQARMIVTGNREGGLFIMIGKRL